MNVSATSNQDSDAREPQRFIGAIDVDAEALAQPRILRSDRAAAAASYVSVLALFVAITRPSSKFVQRHLHLAMVFLFIRVVGVGIVIVGWRWLHDNSGAGELIRSLGTDIGLLIAIGFPVSEIWRSDALPWLLYPVIFSMAASLGGVILAARGRSADFIAFTRADWSDPVSQRSYLGMSAEDERTLARRARDRQIERLQKSSRMLRTEQVRRTRILDIETQIERIQLQREYHDQLLALGEISQRRYEQANQDLDEQSEKLRSQLSGLETRAQMAEDRLTDSSGGGRLRRPAETLIESLAIVTPDGIPIFTYGQFQLDDAIVAGMLSAFDSLSEEVFGSRVAKTSLAEGQVLHFVHGDYVVIMVGFVDEPSPRQIEDLRKMLRQFESANQGPIARKQYDPRYLHEVPLPFRFSERMPRSSVVPPTSR